MKTDSPIQKRLMDIAEVSEHLGISVKTLYSWVHARRIQFVKVGRLVKFDPQDISAWIQARKVPIMDYKVDKV